METEGFRMNDKTTYWIDMAAYDLDTAKAMLETKRYLYVGFMCHQTIEKALKAVIAESGQFPPKIHNLLTLSDRTGLTGKFSPEQKKFITALNPLNIESRYPKYKDKINSMLTPETCKEIISGTEDLFSWIKQYLK